MARNVNVSFSNGKFVLSNFEYDVFICSKNKKIVEVLCKFTVNDKPISLSIYYPSDYRKTKKAFIKRAQALIDILVDNKRLFNYAKSKINPKYKGYVLEVPTSKGFFGFVSLKSFTKEFYNKYYSSSFNLVAVKTGEQVQKTEGNVNETPVQPEQPSVEVAPVPEVNEENKEEVNEPQEEKKEEEPKKKKGGAGAVVFAVICLLVAGVGIGGALYHLKNNNKPVAIDDVIVKFNAGEGVINESKEHSSNVRVKKGSSWKDLKDNSPKVSNDAGTFNYWTVSNAEIKDDYVFNEDTTINADYKIYEFDVTIDPAGGTFEDGGDLPKTKKVKYGTSWSTLVSEDPNLKITTTPLGMNFDTFRDKDNSDITNKDYVFKSKGDTINVTATYTAKDSTVITFSAGGGKFNNGKSAFAVVFEKKSGNNIKWSEAKEQVEGANPTLEGHTHNDTYNCGSEELTDEYEFNERSAVVTANYEVNKYSITAKGAGGKFSDNKDEIKIDNIEHGKKWSEIKNQFEIKVLPEHKKSLFKFKIENTSSYVEDETIITKDLSIVAEYVEEDQYVLTIDAMGGTLSSGASAKSELVYKGALWSAYKPENNPTCTNKTFNKWTIDGELVKDNHEINKDEKICAEYTDTKVTVTINPNGGEFSDGTKVAKEEEVSAGSKWEDIASKYTIKDTSYPTDKTFDVYRVASETGTVATNYTFVTNTTIIASYKSKDSINITLDADGGSFDDSSSAKTISAITGQTWATIKTKLPTKDPTKDGYTFTNWYLDKANPSKAIEDTEIFNSSKTIYANYEVKELQITLSAGSDGSFDSGVATSPKVKYGSTWGDLNTYETDHYKYRVTENDPTTKKFLYFKYKTATVTTPDFLDTKHIFTEDTEIEAYYIDANNKTVVIDPNGGKFNDDSSAVKIAENLNFTTGAKWNAVKPIVEEKLGTSIDIKTPPTGFKLANYKYKDSTGTLQVLTDDSEISSSMLITAFYEPDTVTITLNSKNGGSYTGSVDTKTITPNYGTYYQESSKPDIIKEGYEFAYYVKGDTTTKIDAYHKYTSDETLNAKYYVTLKFDAGEGKLPGANTIKVLEGTKWSAIKDAFTPSAKSTDYTFKAYKIGDTEIDDDYEFKAPATLEANYTLNTPSDFANDSWEKFSKIVSNGFDDISKKDHANGGYNEEFVSNNNTFVGLTRKLKLAGTEYTVRVIDQNVDTISGSEKKAALTFEFVNTISSSDFSLDENYVSWKDSSLRARLQNELYKLMPSELLDTTYGIKSVDKSTYNTENKSNDTTSDKLFVLSASEMGFSKYPDYSMNVKSEGSKYAYFDSASPVLKKDKIYWLRSSDLLVDGFTWAIDKDGNLGIKNTSTDLFESHSNSASAGVAPCFAI